MANDINRIAIIGRLTRDPEVRQVPSGASVAKFSIANNKTYSVNGEKREEVSFFNCIAWGKLADIVKEYCQKGKQVAMEGRLRQNRWQDQQGQNRSTVEIVMDRLQLLGSGQGQFESGSGNRQESANQEPEAPQGEVSKEPEQQDLLDDDYPF